MSKKGGAKEKGKANPADQAMADKQNTLLGIQRECDVYESMLAICSEQLQRSQLESLNLKKKIAELNEKLEKEEELTTKTCSEIFKAFRVNQSNLVAKITGHEAKIQELRNSLEESRNKLEKLKAEKDAIIAEKTKKINEQKQKMEEMAVAFGVRLKEVLEGMSQQIQGRGEAKSD
jgi:chromosome segregation ATPase